MVYNLVMKRVNMHDAKTHLSEYIAKLEPGEVILICNRNEPMAELRKLGDGDEGPRPIGLGKGLATIPDSFFDPLPDDLLRAFEGGE